MGTTKSIITTKLLHNLKKKSFLKHKEKANFVIMLSYRDIKQDCFNVEHHLLRHLFNKNP